MHVHANVDRKYPSSTSPASDLATQLRPSSDLDNCDTDILYGAGNLSIKCLCDVGKPEINELKDLKNTPVFTDRTNQLNAIPQIDAGTTCAKRHPNSATEPQANHKTSLLRHHPSWGRYGVHCIQSLARHLRELHGDGQQWQVDIRHVEYVKSYAPQVDHLVYDMECRPVC